MTRPIATDTEVDRTGLLAFLSARHGAVLATTRADRSPQLSPVTMGVGSEGAVLIASYPERAKVRNLRRRPQASLCVLSEQFAGEWVQVWGAARVIDLPDALDGLVDYYRSISGEHPDWDEYRSAMVEQGKVLISLDVARWGPVSRGGFPARLAGG